MAEIVASLVGPAIELGKVIVAPIKRQFNYLCCFTSNIQSLKDEAQKLNDARAGLQLRVRTAENNVEVILPEVERWLESATQNQIIISGIDAEIPNVKRGFTSFKSRFSLSRKAKKTTEATEKLRRECDFNSISHPAPPPSMGSIPIGETYEFETRKQIEEDIMEALRGGEVKMLGICGMGGVGKTTMAKRIMKRARGEDLFVEILMVVVSQPVDMLKIQGDISESLALELKVESLPARAHKLRARLMGPKKILVVLDDVWERLKLEDLGIPCESGVKGCTVLLTSRDTDVFNAMDIRKVCALQILDEKEAWFLFKEKVGFCVDDQHLVSIAEDITKECKGLPVALVTVGRALKDKKTKSIWEDALQQLKSSNPVDMPDVLVDVYNAMKLSYDFLYNRHAKSVFLLCSLFPEDAEISLEELTWLSLGLGMFEGIQNLEETRNRVCLLVELLKSRFLLIDGYEEHHVKMHDVVRDVAIFIASQEGRVSPNFSSIDWSLEQFYSDCTWISMFPQERIELPIVLNVPRLRLLLIHNSEEREIQMHDQFFEAIKELNVLSFRCISFKSLPQTIQLLKSLVTLHLDFCTLESVSIVGELSSLEILSFRSCHSITELPAEIGRLTRLRLLEFSYCGSLERVAPGVISSLVRLEELKMLGSFKGWEAEKNGKERRNASLNELQSLSNLRCLEIEIDDFTLAAEEIRLSPKIVKYEIKFITSYFEQHEKKMYLKWPREISLGNWILILLKSTEYLQLEGDGSNNLDLAQVQNIKTFYFSDCSTVKKLVSTTSIDWRSGVFPVLESLKLWNLPNLEEICNGPTEALSNLTSVTIHSCNKLRNLFPLKMAKDCLKTLRIWSCSMMEEVFSNDGESIEFPLLTEISIEDCPKLTSFVSCNGNNFHLFCNQKVTFASLKKLTISGCKNISSFCCHHIPPVGFFSKLEKLQIRQCGGIRSLFSSSMARNLVNIKVLEIRNCSMMDKVFSGENENEGEGHFTFPKLGKLSLGGLPSLTTLCRGIEIIEFPLLTKMNITSIASLTGNNPCLARHNDDSLHLFCNQKITFGSLKKLRIEGYEDISNLWCHQIQPGFFSKLETLDMHGCANIRSLFTSSMAANLVNLKCLSIESCNEMVKVIGDDEENVCENSPFFPSLEELVLKSLPNLVNFFGWRCALQLLSLREIEIHGCPRTERFTMGSLTTPKLEIISIGNCDKLHNLSLFKMAKNGLLQLKRLSVEHCKSIEEVFFNVNENDGKCHITFPELKDLSLKSLPSLTTFYKGIESIEFPLLRKMYINECPKLTGFATSTGNNPSVAGHYSDDSFHLFCNQKVTFCSLKMLTIDGYENISNLWCHQIPSAGFFSKLEELDIRDCGSIKSLFSSSIVANLVNLKRLSIESCNQMVKVIGDDEENVCENSPIFPSLEKLHLKYLPNLVNFCGWRCALELPSLRDIEISDCPRMESFTMGSLTTPNLNCICIDYKDDEGDVEDLNLAVQLWFREKLSPSR